MQLEELNREIERCTRCRLSETRTHALCGEGNVNAKLFLVAQAPGENEDREGKMFIGPSGKVLDGLFASIGMEKHTFYMTNLVKCMLPHCRKPKQDEIEACSRYLDREIEIIGSEVLVPLGYYATKYLFEKYTLAEGTRAEFKDVYGKVLYQSGKNILPLPHPAVLIHTPSLRKAVTENYRKLKVVSADCKWYPVCPMKRFYEQGKLSFEWIARYCRGDWERCVRFQMEERGEYHPDRMLPDGTVDEEL